MEYLASAAMSKPTTKRRCVYCGRPTKAKVACRNCRHLLTTDPVYLVRRRNFGDEAA